MVSEGLKSFNREVLKSLGPSLLFLFCFFTVYAFLPNRGYPSLLLLVLCMTWGSTLYKDLRLKTAPKVRDYIKKGLVSGLLITIFYYGAWLLGFYALLGALLFIVILAAYRLYKNRDMYFRGMRAIEKEVFGISLDKDNWKGRKPKMKKVRFKNAR